MDLQNNFRTVKLRELNEILGSLEDFYYRLSIIGFYLPKKEKSCIRTEYLMGVLCGKFFSIKRIDIKLGFPQKKASKLDLLIEI
jgi:hypothetical protein